MTQEFIKHYKVTYIEFKKEYDISSKDSINNRYNQFYIDVFNKEETDEINIEKKMEDMYNNIYQNQENINFNCYIFIGQIDDLEIKSILLDKIEKNINISKEEQTQLNQYFNYNFYEYINVNKYNNIKFIDNIIHEDDKIRLIKTMIYYYINEIHSPEDIYITTLLEKNYISIEKDDDLYDDNIYHNILKKIYINLLEKKKLTVNDLIQELYQFDNSLLYQQYLDKLILTTSDFEKVINDKFIKFFIKKFNRNPHLSHIYKYKQTKSKVYIDNLLALYLDNTYQGYDINIDTKQGRLRKIGNVDESLLDHLLSSFGNIYKNELYIYNFKNIHNYVVDKKLFNLTIKDEEDKYINCFIRKYFPSINVENYKEKYALKREDISPFKDYFQNKYFVLKLLNELNSLSKIYIENIEKKNIYIKIDSLLNIPIYNYDYLLVIFNNLELSNEIPFVKFKEQISKEIVYKIYKNITNILNEYDQPIVSKIQLEEWIKYNYIEYKNKEIIKLRGDPKNLEYKIKIGNFRESNNKYNGEIVQEYKNTMNILDSVTNKVFNIQKKNIEILDEKKVLYYKEENVYADIIITKLGNISISCLLKEYYNNLDEDLLNKYLQIFIDKLKSIDLIKDYNKYLFLEEPSFTLIYNKYNDYILNNNIIQLKFKFLNNIILQFDNIKNLTNIFTSYITYNNEIYISNEDVEYYDQSLSEWSSTTPNYSFKIHKCNPDGTYDLKKISNDVHILDENIQNVDTKFIKKKGDIKNRRFLHLTYKRVNEFNDITPEKKFLQKLIKSGIVGEEILQFELMKRYSLDDTVAKKLIEENSKDIINYRSGIDIFIYINSENINEITVNIEGYKSLYDLNKIKIFLINFFKIYSIKYNIDQADFIQLQEKNSEILNIKEFSTTQESIDNVQNFFETLNNTLDESDTEDVDYLEEHIMKLMKLDKQESDDLEEYQDQEIEEPIEHENETWKSDLKIKKKDEEKEQPKVLEDYLVQEKSEKSPFLKKLLEKDEHLFSKTIGKVRYARFCQSDRQPVVLTTEEKQEIDSKFPDSYKENPNDIDCTSENLREKGDKMIYRCKAIKYGSTAANQNWYICPKIFDFNTNTSLTVDNLDFEGLGKLKPEKKKEYGEDFGKTFESRDINGNNWRESKILNKLTKKYYDILEFYPSYKGNKPLLNKTELTSKNSIYFEPVRSDNKRYTYPGFYSGTDFPCCFQNNSKNLDKLFNSVSKQEEDTDNFYVQDFKKTLDVYRIGLLPEKINKFFNINYTCDKGQLDISKSCFYRVGLPNSYNSFIYLISSLSKTSTYTNIMETIIEKLLNRDLFRSLNRGNLEIIFRDSIYEYIDSYQNYLNYLLSNEFKHHRFLYDLLTRPNILFPLGLILIIFEEIDENKYNIVCPYFMDNEWWWDEATRNDIDKIPVAFAIKKGEYYESIFQYDKNNTPTKTFRRNNPLVEIFIHTLKNKCKIVSNYKIKDQNIELKNQLEKPLNIIELFNIIHNIPGGRNKDGTYKYAKPKFVIDNYNKIIGIYFSVIKLIIPIEPYPIIDATNNLFTESGSHTEEVIISDDMNYFNINSILNNILLDSIETYKRLKEFVKDTNYNINIKQKIINKEKKIVGLQTNMGYVIPVIPTDSKKKSSEYSEYNNLDLFDGYYNLDKDIIEYERFFSKKFFEPKLNIETILLILNELKTYKIKYLLLKDQNICVGIVLHNDILIEIIDINIKDIQDLECNSLYDDHDVIKNISTIDSYEINIDYLEIIKNYYELWQKSNEKIKVKPIQNIIEEFTEKDSTNSNVFKKKIIGILLQNNTIIYFNPSKYVNILKKKDPTKENYIINEIIEIDFYLKINDIKPKLYDSHFIDDRIKIIKHINYKKNILNIIKKNISLFLQKTDNLIIKEYLIKFLNLNNTSIIEKRIIIKEIIKYIIKTFIVVETINELEFYKKNINLNFNCLNDDFDCSNEDICIQKKIIDEENNIDHLYIFELLLKKLFYEDYKLLDDEEQLKKYFITNKLDFAVDKDSKKKLYLSHQYNKKAAQKDYDIFIKNLFINIEDSTNIINKIINIINNDIGKTKCFYRLINILKIEGINTNNLDNIFINFITEDIIRNNYKRLQILENINVDEDEPKYKFNRELELFFYKDDIIADNISKLYQKITRKYYNDLTIYDEISISQEYDKDNIEILDDDLMKSFNKILRCISNNIQRNLSYEITEEHILNKNNSIVTRKINLSDDEFNYIKDYLDYINTDKDECKTNTSNMNLKYEFQFL